MAIQNDVVDDGETRKGGILKRLMPTPKMPKAQFKEYPPEPKEDELMAQVPRPPQKQDGVEEIVELIKGMQNDLNTISNYMANDLVAVANQLKILSNNMVYIEGFLLGRRSR